ncbi:MAG: hypothetical protein ACXWK0_15160 [Caulobacteraceae bacterium]
MIAISLNLILGMLLCCALVLGVRLERKLRDLRDSHADFAKAVSELDQAAGRTESSLATLRAGTETMASLPIMIYTHAISPYEDWHRQAWAAGTVLLVLVLVANLAARWVLSRGAATQRG